MNRRGGGEDNLNLLSTTVESLFSQQVDIVRDPEGSFITS